MEERVDKSGWCVVSCTIDDVPTSRRRPMVNIPSRVINRVRGKTTPSLITIVRGFVRTITVVVERCVGWTWTSLEHTFEFGALSRFKDARQRSEAAAGVSVRRCTNLRPLRLPFSCYPTVSLSVQNLHPLSSQSATSIIQNAARVRNGRSVHGVRLTAFAVLVFSSLQVPVLDQSCTFSPTSTDGRMSDIQTNLGTRVKAAERPHFKSRQAAGVSYLLVCKSNL